jgi:3-methyladenine DNA glycosylase AlkD
MEYEEIIAQLKSMSNSEAVEGMKRFGIKSPRAFGVSSPRIKMLVKKIGKNHQLAQQLWQVDMLETRAIACMIDEPRMVTEEQMEKWVHDFDSWAICDGCCNYLFRKTKFAHQKCFEWSSREEEYVKRAGFVMMAVLAVHDKKAADEQFEKFLPIIKRESVDERNFVKKAINWALRQIGKRNLSLNKKAIETAQAIKKIDSRSARWIASDALRELTSQAVQNRLEIKNKRGLIT